MARQQQQKEIQKNQQQSGTSTESENTRRDREGETGLERQRAGMQRQDRPGMMMSPFSFMRQFSEQMDRLFEDFAFGGPRSFGGGIERRSSGSDSAFGGLSQWSPQTEVFERDDHIVIRADLPGMNKDDVDVELDENKIVIRGERRDERGPDERGFSERSYGSFYRSIPLPQGIDGDKAKADFTNGMLEITLPKPEQEKTRRRLEIGEGNKEEERPKARSKAAGK